MDEKTDRIIQDLIERGKRAREKIARAKLARGDAAQAHSLRGRALRRGYRLSRSKFRIDPAYNCGGYMLSHENGPVVLGLRYDATLDEIDAFLG